MADQEFSTAKPDLQAIEVLTPSNDDILQRKAGAWANRTIAQLKTDLAYTIPVASDTAYDATSWNANTDVPTKNAVRDKIEAILAGVTFTGDIVVPDEAYDATAWNGSLEVPTKNAIRDKIETMGGGGITNSAGANVIPKSDGTNIVASSFSNASSGLLSTPHTEAVLEQTGDTLGTTRLRLQNRAGAAGAIFENAGIDLVDFTFAGSASSLSFRMEGRSGAWISGAKEFEIHDGGTIFHAFSSFGHYIREGSAATGVANSVILYCVDNGSGKSKLMAIFGSGAAQQIAIEP